MGQEHITTTLSNALKSGRISHAYLFTGPHGVGKTSVARILAHAVNGLPYDDESNHIDIIEIDAASNRRIDEIRDLRDKVHISPTSAKYKVYIIDEVHMLTKEAFNALLKTLEEPPEHVIFILATTEAHKLPETIISRTQRYSFKPIEQDLVISQLRTIAKNEGLAIEAEALKLIAEHGDGSFRDSISLLDQASDSGTKLTLSEVERMLGIAPSKVIAELLNTLEHGSNKELINLLNELRDRGYQPTSISNQLSDLIRNRLIAKELATSDDLALDLLSKLLEVPASINPERLLEIILLGTTLELGNSEPRLKAGKRLSPQINKTTFIDQDDTSSKATEETKQTLAANRIIEELPSTEIPKPKHQNFSKTVWQSILDDLKKQHSTLYGLLRMCEPSLSDNTLTLSFRFPFHQKQMQESKNNQKFTDIVDNYLKKPFQVEYVTKKAPSRQTGKVNFTGTARAKSPVDTISNIFGGAEVLES